MSTTSATTTQQVHITATPPPLNQYSPADNDATFQATARGDRDGTLKLRGIPTFTDRLAQRQWMKEHMAAAFRFFGKQGYGEGISGHISMRGGHFFFFPLLRSPIRPVQE